MVELTRAACADRVLGALRDRGVDAQTTMRLHVILHGFIQGLAVNLEAEAVSATGMHHDPWVDTQLDAFETLARSGRYPSFAATLDGGFELAHDELFEQDLAALLDGFARRIERRR